MNLSIFNFKAILTVALCVSMLTLYSFWLSTRSSQTTHYSNQWIENKAIAERYVYLESAPETVVVGSSMAARMIDLDSSKGYYNLSFASSSALTGLAIIEKSGVIPKHVFIEANTIEKPLDEEFIRSLFYPVVWSLKKDALFSHKSHQPVNLLNTAIMANFKKKELTLAQEQQQFKTKKKLLEGKINYNTTRLDRIVNADFSQLKAIIDRLGKKGTQFTIFEMPVHPALNDSPAYRIRDDRIKRGLVGITYLNLSSEEHGKYVTSDGNHLLPASARHFGEILQNLVL